MMTDREAQAVANAARDEVSQEYSFHLEDLDREAAEQEAARERERRRAELLESAGIPARLWRDVRERHEAYPAPAEERLRGWLDRWCEDAGAGLYLWGPVGTGKSHLAVWLARELLEDGRRAVFVNVAEWLDEIRQTYGVQGSGFRVQGTAKKRSEGELWAALEGAEVVVLDDFGKEIAGRGAEKGQWVREKVYRLVNGCYERLQSVLITSNHRLDEIEDWYGPAIAGRIMEMCEPMKMDGPDRRRAAPANEECRMKNAE